MMVWTDILIDKYMYLKLFSSVSFKTNRHGHIYDRILTGTEKSIVLAKSGQFEHVFLISQNNDAVLIFYTLQLICSACCQLCPAVSTTHRQAAL